MRLANPNDRTAGGRAAVSGVQLLIVMVGKILLPEIRDMIAERDFAALRDLFREMPPADVAEVILDLPGLGDVRAEDLGDGSYQFRVPRSVDQNPLLTLSVSGGQLFSGKLSELRARR